MATRKSSATTPTIADLMTGDESINDWAITDSTALSVTWTNPTTGERINLKPGMKPSENIVSVARMNGAILAAIEPPSMFDDGETFNAHDEIEDEPTPVDRLLTLLRDESAGDRAEVKIYRMRDGQKDSYCGSFKPEEFESENLELIRKHFGAGKFRVKVYATHPATNKFVIRMNETVEIEASAIQIQTGNAQHDKLDLLMQRFDRMENQSQTGNASGMGGMKEMLQMFVMMKQAFGGETHQRSSIVETVEAIRALKEVSGEIGGGGGSGSPDLLSMGGEVLKLIAQQQNNQPAQFQPQLSQHAEAFPVIQSGPPPQPVYQNNPISENAVVQHSESENEMNPMIKIMFSVILKKAAAGAPVDPIAADLYPRLPDDLLNGLESDMWFDLLQEFHPGVKDHEAWFTALRAAILAEIAKDEEGA